MKCTSWLSCQRLPVQIVSLDVGCNLLFPLVPIHEEFLLVVEQLLVGLRGKLKVWALEK